MIHVRGRERERGGGRISISIPVHQPQAFIMSIHRGHRTKTMHRIVEHTNGHLAKLANCRGLPSVARQTWVCSLAPSEGTER